MATYKYADNGTSLKVTDRPVYGSSRIGSFTRQMELMGEPAMHQWPYTQPMQAPLKRYELTDHLGNVATVVTGRLLPLLGPGVQYQAEVVSAQTLEPYGSLLPNRNWNSNAYKWGLNGQLKDDEVYGPTGTSTTAEFWQYDTRAVRRWNLDPEPQISISDYAAFTLSPILYNDPRGNSATKYETKDGRELLNTNDGKDIVVTVPDRLVKPMEHFAANNSKETLNSPEWNSNMTNTALKMGGTWDRSLGGKVKDALGVVGEMWTDPQMVMSGLSLGVAGLSSLRNVPRSVQSLRNATAAESNLPSIYRVTQPGESFIRYEAANMTRVTATGGVTPGTYAAPASDGLRLLDDVIPTYNLFRPEVPRVNYVQLTPPPGTLVVGPRPVAGGTGTEVLFPMGIPSGSVGPVLPTPR